MGNLKRGMVKLGKFLRTCAASLKTSKTLYSINIQSCCVIMSFLINVLFNFVSGVHILIFFKGLTEWAFKIKYIRICFFKGWH